MKTLTFDPSLYVVVPRAALNEYLDAHTVASNKILAPLPEQPQPIMHADVMASLPKERRDRIEARAAARLAEPPEGGDRNLEGLLACAETDGYWKGRQAVRDEVMAVLQAPAAGGDATAPSALQEFVREQRQVEVMAAAEAKDSSSIRAVGAQAVKLAASDPIDLRTAALYARNLFDSLLADENTPDWIETLIVDHRDQLNEALNEAKP